MQRPSVATALASRVFGRCTLQVVSTQIQPCEGGSSRGGFTGWRNFFGVGSIIAGNDARRAGESSGIVHVPPGGAHVAAAVPEQEDEKDSKDSNAADGSAGDGCCMGTGGTLRGDGCGGRGRAGKGFG